MAIKGRDLRIYLNGATLGGEKSCKLQIKSDIKEVASVNSGIWKEFKNDRLSWSVSGGGFITNNPKTISDLMISRTPVAVKLKSIDNDICFIYSGNAIITDFEQSGEVKGRATYNISLKGTGILNCTDLTFWIESLDGERYEMPTTVSILFNNSNFYICSSKELDVNDWLDVVFAVNSSTVQGSISSGGYSVELSKFYKSTTVTDLCDKLLIQLIRASGINNLTLKDIYKS